MTDSYRDPDERTAGIPKSQQQPAPKKPEKQAEPKQENPEEWRDPVCSCEPEPYWQAVADEEKETLEGQGDEPC